MTANFKIKHKVVKQILNLNMPEMPSKENKNTCKI